jgi:hypothetical protein
MSPYRVDARLSGRHPFEIFALYLAFLTSLPIVLGITPQPGSIRSALPPWLSFTWATVLLAGSGVAIFGIYWRERATGLICEQLGLALVGVGSLIYCACVLYVVGAGAGFTVAIVGGFGISCLRRYWQIQSVLDDVHEVEKRFHS